LDFSFLAEGSNLTSFQCNNDDLNDFLKRDAFRGQNSRISATRLVYWNTILIGFFTLVNDTLTVEAVEACDGEPEYEYGKYPAIKIARLATHGDYERRDIATNMLLKIFIMVKRISKHSGCRMITVDSYPDAVGFYQRKGFKRAQLKEKDTIPLYMDFHKFDTEEENRLIATLDDF